VTWACWRSTTSCESSAPPGHACSTSRCSTTRRERPVPELAIAVEADARGAGVGGALLDALADAAKQAGHRELSLRVSPRNPAARLYRRRGFEPARKSAEELIMRRRLA
jgi:GNAT superfamily N-acetyltransferase